MRYLQRRSRHHLLGVLPRTTSLASVEFNLVEECPRKLDDASGVNIALHVFGSSFAFGLARSL